MMIRTCDGCSRDAAPLLLLLLSALLLLFVTVLPVGAVTSSSSWLSRRMTLEIPALVIPKLGTIDMSTFPVVLGEVHEEYSFGNIRWKEMDLQRMTISLSPLSSALRTGIDLNVTFHNFSLSSQPVSFSMTRRVFFATVTCSGTMAVEVNLSSAVVMLVSPFQPDRYNNETVVTLTPSAISTRMTFDAGVCSTMSSIFPSLTADVSSAVAKYLLKPKNMTIPSELINATTWFGGAILSAISGAAPIATFAAEWIAFFRDTPLSSIVAFLQNTLVGSSVGTEWVKWAREFVDDDDATWQAIITHHINLDVSLATLWDTTTTCDALLSLLFPNIDETRFGCVASTQQKTCETMARCFVNVVSDFVFTCIDSNNNDDRCGQVQTLAKFFTNNTSTFLVDLAMATRAALSPLINTTIRGQPIPDLFLTDWTSGIVASLAATSDSGSIIVHTVFKAVHTILSIPSTMQSVDARGMVEEILQKTWSEVYHRLLVDSEPDFQLSKWFTSLVTSEGEDQGVVMTWFMSLLDALLPLVNGGGVDVMISLKNALLVVAAPALNALNNTNGSSSTNVSAADTAMNMLLNMTSCVSYQQEQQVQEHGGGGGGGAILASGYLVNNMTMTQPNTNGNRRFNINMTILKPNESGWWVDAYDVSTTFFSSSPPSSFSSWFAINDPTVVTDAATAPSMASIAIKAADIKWSTSRTGIVGKGFLGVALVLQGLSLTLGQEGDGHPAVVAMDMTMAPSSMTRVVVNATSSFMQTSIMPAVSACVWPSEEAQLERPPPLTLPPMTALPPSPPPPVSTDINTGNTTARFEVLSSISLKDLLSALEAAMSLPKGSSNAWIVVLVSNASSGAVVDISFSNTTQRDSVIAAVTASMNSAAPSATSAFFLQFVKTMVAITPPPPSSSTISPVGVTTTTTVAPSTTSTTAAPPSFSNGVAAAAAPCDSLACPTTTTIIIFSVIGAVIVVLVVVIVVFYRRSVAAARQEQGKKSSSDEMHNVGAAVGGEPSPELRVPVPLHHSLDSARGDEALVRLDGMARPLRLPSPPQGEATLQTKQRSMSHISSDDMMDLL